MRRVVVIYRVFLLTLVLLMLLGASAWADSTPVGQTEPATASLLSVGQADLSPGDVPMRPEALLLEGRPYTLFAMNHASEEPARSTERPKRDAAMQRWHKYLGYGTIVLAGLTAVTNSNEDVHESLAYLTAGGALSTVLTGYLSHGDRFDTSQGLLSRDNLHIVFGTVGAAILTTAVVIADGGKESSHSSLGVAGGVLMTLAVIDIKW
jgi:hypothetical protein